MKYKKIIPLLIGLLGFAVSCDKEDDEDEDNGGIQLMYGVPASTYQEKSMVEIEQTLIVLDEESPSNE